MSDPPSECDICHIITDSTWGGAQRIVLSLVTGTAANASVVCNSGGRLVTELRKADVPVCEIPALQSAPNPLEDVRALVQVTAHLRENEYDLVHCHSTKAGAVGRLAAAITGTPSVFTVHGWGFSNTAYDRFGPVIRLGERALAHATTKIVCVSEHDRAIGRQYDIFDPRDGRVIHNGIEPITLSEDRPTLTAVCDIGPDQPIIGFLGRLSHQKHPEAVVDIGDRLHTQGHDPAIVLIGDGPRYDAVAQHAETTDADVHLLGFREDAHSLLSDFDVFVLPSRFEGLPLTVLECLHVGVPVVATDVGGVAEAVIDGETGYIVPPGEIVALAECVGDLLNDPKRRVAMSERCRSVADRFTAERMVAEYEAVYAEILNDD